MAPDDYRCLDFEAGLPQASEWELTVAGEASLSLSTLRASSLPNSMQVSVEAETVPADADRGVLSWTASGAAPVSSATVTLAVNPERFPSLGALWSGSIELVCLSNSVDSYCVRYTYSNNLVGFYLSTVYSGGVALAATCPIALAIPAKTWSTLELTVSGTAPPTLRVNGVAAATGDCLLQLDADSSITVRVGLRATPNTASGLQVHFDNIEGSVER